MRALCLLLALVTFAAAPLYTVPPRPREIWLVADNQPQDAAPKHFRKDPGGLRMSGSGTFNRQQLVAIQGMIDASPVLVVDLRQEPHGLLNGGAITWTAEHDWTAAGLSRDEALDLESDLLAGLRSQRYVRVGELVTVREVQSEEDAVRDAGWDYARLTVTDHLRPSDEDVDRFVELVESHPDHWLHVHCRGGDGRTTTFMVMRDMLANAGTVGMDEIVKRQASVAPYYNLFEHRASNISEYHNQRMEFVRWFYRYAEARKQGYPGSWSEWISEGA